MNVSVDRSTSQSINRLCRCKAELWGYHNVDKHLVIVVVLIILFDFHSSGHAHLLLLFVFRRLVLGGRVVDRQFFLVPTFLHHCMDKLRHTITTTTKQWTKRSNSPECRMGYNRG